MALHLMETKQFYKTDRDEEWQWNAQRRFDSTCPTLRINFSRLCSDKCQMRSYDMQHIIKLHTARDNDHTFLNIKQTRARTQDQHAGLARTSWLTCRGSTSMRRKPWHTAATTSPCPAASKVATLLWPGICAILPCLEIPPSTWWVLNCCFDSEMFGR